MEFKAGDIEGVILRPLKKFYDGRGWLCELFRHDELDARFHPVMAYASVTEAGVARGPHEHVDQTDCFCFIGPSNFKLYLWDNRPASKTHRHSHIGVYGADQPMLAIIPPGVVHAYQNVGSEPGLVFNCPNQLYKGLGKKEPVDEIRHEDVKDSPFRLE